jgi:hypothetical protein
LKTTFEPFEPENIAAGLQEVQPWGKVPHEAEIQYLKQHLLAKAVVHHEHCMHMPHDLFDPNPTDSIQILQTSS